MLPTKELWQKFEVSPEGSHHILDQRPAYSAKFLSVLKFHEPGLAPAQDESGAFHINVLGESVYDSRFLRTFGFYEGGAAAYDASGWFHILPDGTELYPHRFAWCGNYQQGQCTVRDGEGAFFHIDRDGKRSYPQSYRYAGDFRDGIAVVQNAQGFHTHITCKGEFLHGKQFLDLDVYHKGFARARDQEGWFHISLQGEPLYGMRYKNIEPFYNGVARVETFQGELLLISEQGAKIATLREAVEDAFHPVSAELVSYWRFYTLQAAHELQLFDHLPNSAPLLSNVLALPEASTIKLLRALEEMGFVEVDKKTWQCSRKGVFLQSTHPHTLKHACRLWSEEHLICWRHIVDSLKTGLPAFNQLYGKGWFEWLEEHPDKNRLYHEALAIYAKRDYQAVCASIDFKKHRSVLDVGGSSGVLLSNILSRNSHLQGLLLDLPKVVQSVKIPEPLKERFHCISTDFFDTWPSLEVESAVLSRVLHDWQGQEALIILKRVHAALSSNADNRLYVIEKIQDDRTPHGALLDLNMLIMTGGVERTLQDFEALFRQAGFVLEKILPLNEVSSVLVAKKEGCL